MPKRTFLIQLIVLLLATTTYAQDYEANRIHLQYSTLTNFYRIDEGVYRSDQPSKEDFIALEKYGIREVLNLRFFNSDKEVAAGTSLTLHHVRSNAFSISEKQLIEMMRIIKERKGPILIHCLHGSDRTGAVVALYRMVFQNIPREEAIREMREGGFGHHKIFFNITNLLRGIDVDKVRREIAELGDL